MKAEYVGDIVSMRTGSSVAASRLAARQAVASSTEPTSQSTGEGATKPPATRFLSVDAYRGFIMALLLSRGLGLPQLAGNTDVAWLGWIGTQFQHVQWEGVHLWDLILPGFLFVVGLAMPFALARRASRGDTFRQLLGHVARRSLVLLIISFAIVSIQTGFLHVRTTEVLSQIALTYFLAFLIIQLRPGLQVLAAVAILAGHWGLFVLFPGSQGPFSQLDNVGAVIDHATVAHFWNEWTNPGHNVTINFVSSTIFTLAGAWTARLLMSTAEPKYKVRVLAAAGIASVIAALALEPVNPMIKRLMTTSFTLCSTGWVVLGMAVFYWFIEMKGYRRWTFPLAVLGMNSIFIYCVDYLLRGWLRRSLEVFTGGFELIGPAGLVVQSSLLLLVLWYVTYWLYRHRVFVKV